MKDERIGVEVVLTNRYSIWDGVAVAISDAVNSSEPDIRFYNGRSEVNIIQGLLREGLEISKVCLLTYRWVEMADLIALKEKLAYINRSIKVELVDEKADPFKDIEIPPNH